MNQGGTMVTRTAPVRRAVEEMLTTGDLKPGERLNELALASRLGVGRAAVRETVRALEHDGILISRPNQGAFVSVVDLDAALDIYDTNAVLSGFAAHELAGRASAEQCLALAETVDSMQGAIEGGDTERYADLNLKFHDLVFAYAANRHAASIYRAAVRKLALLRRRTFQSLENMRSSNDEHRLILDAIVTKRPDRARSLAEEHGLRGRKRFLLANGKPASSASP